MGKATKHKLRIADKPASPPQEQIDRGGFHQDYVLDENTGLKALAYRNTGHDPVARWLRDGKLDQRQKAAIDTVRRLWDLVGIRQRVTANYGERLGGSVNAELCSLTVLEAMEDLDRIEGYFAGLSPYWRIFENVCRFGEAAGTAGESVGYSPKSAQVRALTTVCFVADIIATRERI